MRPESRTCWSSQKYVNLAGEQGLLALVAGPNVVRFTPSLIIPFEDIDEGLSRFEQALEKFSHELKECA